MPNYQFAVLIGIGIIVNQAWAISKGRYDVDEAYLISAGREVNIEYENTQTENPYRISAWSTNANIDLPVILVVRQQRRVQSWSIPLVIEKKKKIFQYYNTSRTLCFDDPAIAQSVFEYSDKVALKRNFTILLSTSSPTPVKVVIRISEVQNFFITDATSISAVVGPSEPAYYSYTFNKDDTSSTTFINITSPDNVCLTASVQDRVCPVQDLATDVMYQGKYETVLKQGGMIIRKSSFPNGFFLVFIANVDNTDCETTMKGGIGFKGRKLPNQHTLVTFEIEPGLSKSDYVKAILITVFSILGVCLICAIFPASFYFWGPYRREKRRLRECETIQCVNEVIVSEDNVDLRQEEFFVKEFAKKTFRNERRSNNYLWHIANIALFYGIPVTQLMVTYQMTVSNSGNHDICYHNYLCSHPMLFTDFNHIFSNIGYILFGCLFFAIVLIRNVLVRNKEGYGIPSHYGLFYAMACALVFEGIFSANYHICPTLQNFQFDTSFMYIMASLIIIKLYQNRHPDINASAYATFGVLGGNIFLAMIGILTDSQVVVIIFAACDIFLCIYVSFNVYFFSAPKTGLRNAYDDIRVMSTLKSMIPYRKLEFTMLVLANVVNISIAIVGIIMVPSSLDFGTFLLGILMLNACLYLIFYIAMKLKNKERVCAESILYLTISMLLWGFSGYFFISAATDSSLSPAESRQYNQECLLLNFYDTHDIWHLLSAPALFFSFMALLKIDDDLLHVPQKDIHAF